MSLLLVSSGFSADKLAFVGFKGSFHPDWVYLEADSERAKIHQVLPVPVIHKMKLWVAVRVGRMSQVTIWPWILTHTHTTPSQNNINAQSHTHAHYSQLLRATDPGSCGVYSAFGYEKGWCESMWKVEAPLTELALPVMNCQVITPSLAAMLAVSSWRQ